VKISDFSRGHHFRIGVKGRAFQNKISVLYIDLLTKIGIANSLWHNQPTSAASAATFYGLLLITVFPRIVSPETILFCK
jgi:hypothetical protein